MGRKGPYTTGWVKEPTTHVGAFLRDKRIAQGLTIEQLTVRIGITVSGIVRIELGNIRAPEKPTLEKFALALGLNVDELLALRDKDVLKSIDAKTFAEFLRARRLELAFSAAELGRRLKCSTSSIHDAEAGTVRLQRVSTAVLAEVLGCKEEVIQRLRISPKKKAPEIIRQTALGKRITEQRVSLNLTLQFVADQLHVTREFVRKIEMGQCGIGKTARVEELARILHMDVQEIQNLAAQRIPTKKSAKPKAAPAQLPEMLTPDQLMRRVTQEGWKLQLVKKGVRVTVTLKQ